MNGIERSRQNNIDVVTCRRPFGREFFFNLQAEGLSPEIPFQAVADTLREMDAVLVSLEVFGGLRSGQFQDELLGDAFGKRTFPCAWIEEKTGPATRIAGIQAWAISGPAAHTLDLDGKIMGAWFETPEARYCRLGGVLSSDSSQNRCEQASDVFQMMNRLLRKCDMRFEHVVRTWFFNHCLLDWYSDFNATRDSFFHDQRVYDHLVPASTGIEGGNPHGSALIAGLLAVHPKIPNVAARALPSPLQCPALKYGSSFSRAAEIDLPGMRRVYISGTASIGPDGQTVHQDNLEAQVRWTMEVVAAILQSRDMTWSDVSRAIAYFKHSHDIPMFTQWISEIPAFPLICVHNDVCRDDLLFEIELDALRITLP